MGILNSILNSLTHRERVITLISLIIFLLSLFTRGVFAIQENSELVPVKGGTHIEGVIGQPSSINPIISNNPIDQDLSSLVYSTLGDLASNVSVENEGRTYIVSISEGLTWSDGERLTADDIVFTVNTIQDPEISSPLSKSWQGVVAERVSELQVRFNLPAPYAFFNNNINRLPIIPVHIFGSIPSSNFRLSTYSLEPIGSGPYEFEDFKRRRDGFITEYNFSVNKNYHKEEPFIQNFRFKFFESEQDIIDSFKRREIDGFGTLSLPRETYSNLSRSVVNKVQMPRYYSLFFNPRSTSALGDSDLRLALRSVIDKDDLIKNIEGAISINGPLYFEDIDLLSKEEAEEIITESKGEDDSLEIEIIIPDIEFIKETAEFIKNKWEETGVNNVSIIPMTSEDFATTVIRERNYEAVIFGNVLENPLDLFPFWHSSQRFYPGLNLSLYSNSEADTLIEDLRQTSEKEARLEIFKEVVSIINQDSPAIFLFTLPYTYIHNEKLGGINSERFNIVGGGLVTPSDRFNNVSDWYVKQARVFKNSE